jgi:hypothetical protein
MAATDALDELQRMDPYYSYFGHDLGAAITAVKNELEVFKIERAMIEVVPEQGPIFIKR